MPLDDTSDSPSPFETPVINAASVDFEFSASGISAKVPERQEISETLFQGDCENRRVALIENTRDIAGTVTNRLGEATRSDLNAYWQHLLNENPANPHRLDFLAKGIEADASDPLVSEGFDARLKMHLATFQATHRDFIAQCIPEAAEALEFKRDLKLERHVTKEEATDILNTLNEAIQKTDAATQSVQDVLDQLKAHDDRLNALHIKAYSENDAEKLEVAVEAETKELITLTSRLYWRARQVLGTAGKVSWRAGEGAAIVCSTSGKSLAEISQFITTKLGPLMHKFMALVNGLPPL